MLLQIRVSIASDPGILHFRILLTVGEHSNLFENKHNFNCGYITIHIQKCMSLL